MGTSLEHSARTRPAALLAIAAAHAGLIGLVGPLTSRPVPTADLPPLEVSLSLEKQPEIAAPPVVPRLVEPAPPAIELPLVQWPEEPAPGNAISVTQARSAPQPASAPQNRAITVDDVAYLEPPRPRYPAESRRSGERGLVLLRVTIDERGRAVRIEIQQSSGHARLDAAARAAVEHALFRPYLEDGVARTVLATIPIEFNFKPRGQEGQRRG